MRGHRQRLLSPALFGLTLFLFSLPFVTVSCPGGAGATLTGTDLALGITVFDQETEPSWELLCALGISFLGLAIGVLGLRLRHRSSAFAAGILGTVGAMLLAFFRIRAAIDVMKQEVELATVSFHAGFWLCLTSFAVAAALGFRSCAGAARDQASGVDAHRRGVAPGPPHPPAPAAGMEEGREPPIAHAS